MKKTTKTRRSSQMKVKKQSIVDKLVSSVKTEIMGSTLEERLVILEDLSDELETLLTDTQDKIDGGGEDDDDGEDEDDDEDEGEDEDE
jgi:hypothetical protein